MQWTRELGLVSFLFTMNCSNHQGIVFGLNNVPMLLNKKAFFKLRNDDEKYILPQCKQTHETHVCSWYRNEIKCSYSHEDWYIYNLICVFLHCLLKQLKHRKNYFCSTRFLPNVHLSQKQNCGNKSGFHSVGHK